MMPTEQVTESRQAAPATTPPPTWSRDEDEEAALRQVAIKQVERVRSFKLHVIAFVVLNLLIGVIWVLTEYFDEEAWPSRFADSDDGVPGTWNPWFFYVLGISTIVLAIDALKTFGHRAPTEKEIQRELERISSRR
jgi:hypothetical protein